MALAARVQHGVPEDRFGQQPVVGAEGRFRLVADLRLDNRAELVAALGLDRTAAAGMADAELLMQGFLRWGEAVVEHLCGEFAFALWDARDGRLLLARDRLGDRALHVHLGRDRIAFATLPQALVALPGVPNAPDPVRLAGFLLLRPEFGPRSFFAGIDRIEPGHCAWVEADGRFLSRRWWHPEAVPLLRLSRTEDYAEGLRDVLDRAVAAQLRRIGTAASQLSSGYDSSAVTASAALQLGGGEPLHAFTHVPAPGYRGTLLPGRHGDEGPMAATVAALYPNVCHHRVVSGGGGAFDGLDALDPLLARPLVNPINAAWFAQILQQARALGATSLLTGSYGNLTISYDGAHALAEAMVQRRPLAFARRYRAFARGDFGAAAARRMACAPLVPNWLRGMRRRNRGQGAAAALNPMLLRNPDLREELAQAGVLTPERRWNDATAMRIFTLRRRERGDLQTGFAAHTGIDMRDPTSDARVVDYCLSVSTELFSHRGQRKWLFRAAFGSRLPQPLLDAGTRGLQGADGPDRVVRSQSELVTRFRRARVSDAARQILDIDELLAIAARADDPARLASQEMWALLQGAAVTRFLHAQGWG